ncbi:uncharacterized protein YpmS [Streptococcus rupicaprae]|uniref:Uncharacterized protein YpmS n=1 Tax=Streptococcus rupicaprae TaxID=759619 RepID=A0ABV2FEQ8_9STRE
MKQARVGKGKKKINGWKWLFILYLGAQLALVRVVWQRVGTKREDLALVSHDSQAQLQMGTFTTNRDQLNQTLKAYLGAYQSKAFTYDVFVTEKEVVFEGTYEILGAKIPLYIYFTPYKDENGAVVLDVTEVSAGTLSLPKSEVLKYIKKAYPFPDFIQISAEEGRILVNLPHLTNKFGVVVTAKTIDLYNDHFIFEIFRKTD